ncbi:acyltransferase family protein [Microbacterium thalassium]|uniref:Peptidoglycan/LPS O-acetylase OafA/YrhL n=1 Tax=Microbacterium thalassium TaxID=362649 RepID=A0A7X0KUE2_9MICO|nr:acyltransferase [Microbacterium thalassium]MBB6391067.1 peptidoglycan/LPS O-acetylase OafA/YrhL [Microbacterium thalassium]GLK23823.1 hypothetical protein GCM10017607_11410 [Microbacterium thalassium]
MSDARRVRGLDLLRGLAILLVMLRHAWPEIFGGAGIVGVVIFFALSGYLITGLLLNDLGRFGRVRYGRFYLHRAFRLLPALVVVVLAFVVIEGILDVRGQRDLVPHTALLALTYTMNIPGIGDGSWVLDHLWTLATEEQFYLLWPLLLAFSFRMGRRVAHLATAGLAGAILIALAASLVWAAPDYALVYTYPTSWAIAMIIGSAARMARARLSATPLLKPGSTSLRFLAALALLAIMALSFMPEAKHQWLSYALLGPAVALSTVVMILFLLHWEELPSKLLLPFQWLGSVSYAAYLWNLPMVAWVAFLHLGAWDGFASIIATLVMATASWFFVESPVQRLRARMDKRTEERQQLVLTRA